MRIKKQSLLMGSALLFMSAVSFSAVKTDKAAPDFKLPGVKNESVSLSSFKGKYVVLEWTNYDCPFVKKHYDSNNMQALQNEFTAKDVIWLSIASSAKEKQGHYDKAQWAKLIEEKGSGATDVLLDPTGKVGKQYGAKTTPHMYVINPEGVLIYQGAIDDKSTADKADVAGAKNYVKEALHEALSGKAVTTKETTAYGCSVKY